MLGVNHPDKLLGELSSMQLSEWMAYVALRGMPQGRSEFMTGQVCAMLANTHRAKDAKEFEAADFIILDRRPEAEELETVAVIDPEEQAKALERMLGRKE